MYIHGYYVFCYQGFYFVCYIDRMDAYPTGVYTRTGLLPFLPAPFSNSPRTYGILALVRRSTPKIARCFTRGNLSSFTRSIFTEDTMILKLKYTPRMYLREYGRTLPPIWMMVETWQISPCYLTCSSLLRCPGSNIRRLGYQIPGEVLILTALGPSVKEYFRGCNDDRLHLYSGTFYTHSSIGRKSDGEDSDDEHITGSGLQYLGFRGLAAERLRFPGIDQDECRFVISRDPIKKVEGEWYYLRVWNPRSARINYIVE